jgi:hypothetical protein
VYFRNYKSPSPNRLRLGLHRHFYATSPTHSTKHSISTAVPFLPSHNAISYPLLPAHSVLNHGSIDSHRPCPFIHLTSLPRSRPPKHPVDQERTTPNPTATATAPPPASTSGTSTGNKSSRRDLARDGDVRHCAPGILVGLSVDPRG